MAMPPRSGRRRGARWRGRRRCGGCKDINGAWAAGVLRLHAWPAAEGAGTEGLMVPQDLRETWAERVAIMVADGGVPRAEAEYLAWVGLQTPGKEP